MDTSSETLNHNIAKGGREKVNKCSLCDYASGHAGHLRTHMKAHSGEKSHKCHQCDHASSHLHHLKRHLKMHSGEKSYKCNQCDYASSYPHHLKTHLKTHSGEKSHKCNHCDYASPYPHNLKRHLKIHSEEELHINATNVILQLFKRAIWGDIWKLTLVKSRKNATNVTMFLSVPILWGDIWELMQEKNCTNATNVILQLLKQAIWGNIWIFTLGKNQTKETFSSLHRIKKYKNVSNDHAISRNHLLLDMNWLEIILFVTSLWWRPDHSRFEVTYLTTLTSWLSCLIVHDENDNDDDSDHWDNDYRDFMTISNLYHINELISQAYHRLDSQPCGFWLSYLFKRIHGQMRHLPSFSAFYIKNRSDHHTLSPHSIKITRD